VSDNGADLGDRSGRHPVDLFDEPAVAFHEARVQPVAFVGAGQIRHADSDVQVVAAGLQNVAPIDRVLFVTTAS
jgi:hypothetical protein